MTDPISYQRAQMAYGIATEQSISSEQLWLRSVSYMRHRIEQAKLARGEGNFEAAHRHHERILRILSVLQSHLPDRKQLALGDPTRDAAMAIHDIYDRIRSTLRAIAAKKQAEELYDGLMKQLEILQRSLEKAQGAPKAMEVPEQKTQNA